MAYSGASARDLAMKAACASAQPRQSDPEWDATCRRLLATYVNGLKAAER